MSVFRRGDIWWYEFWFANRRVRESAKTASKTLAKAAEQQRRRAWKQALTISKTPAKSAGARSARSRITTWKAIASVIRGPQHSPNTRWAM
jgi:hypothetical protein